MTRPCGYRVLYADGTVMLGQCQLPDDISGGEAYPTVRNIVLDVIGRDNHLERVNVFWEGSYTDMFIDEEGMLKGLPVNIQATIIYWENVRVHDPKLYRPDDPNEPRIHGDAVLFARRVWY